MKKLLFLFLCFCIAVAVSSLLVNEKGYILIAMGDLTIESTVVTAIIMLVLLFIALIVLLKVLRGGMRFSLSSWNKIAFASRRRALRDFNKGMAAYVLEDYQQAEHLMAKCADASSFENSAHLIAASAAQKQGLAANTKHYLALLEDSDISVKDLGLESVLVAVQLLKKEESYDKARKLIDEHHRHIGHDHRLLALEIDLCLIEKRFTTAVDYLISARKNKQIDDARVQVWEGKAFSGAFEDIITQQDNTALSQYWKDLARNVKRRESVVLAYCHVLAKHNIIEPLNKIIQPVVKKGGDSGFIKSIRTLPLQSAGELIAIVQKHLHHDQHNPLWLSLLAHLAIVDKQWPMAEKAFNSLVHLDGEQYDDTDLIAFAHVHQHLGQLDKANQILLKLV